LLLCVIQVFYHLEEFSDALKYALGAGAHFDVSSKSEYVETLIAKAIDQYINVRVKPSKLVSIDSDEAMEVETTDTAVAAEMDPRLEAIVDRMFDRCFADGEYKQALGIALESRRLDRLRASIEQSGDVLGLLSYALGIALTRISQREFRHDVLMLLVEVYTTLANPDALAIAQCLLFLNDAKRVAEVLQTLLQKDTVEAALTAYQVAFDLSENQNQPFLLRIVTDLPKPFAAPAASPETGAEPVALTATQLQYNDRLKNLIGILSGETASDLHLQFLYTRSKTDLLIITQLKDKLESRNSVTNSSAVIAHAMMQCGTTVDTFLRDNLAWLGRATHWAKFTATASIGVIHKGHRKESMKLLGSYLPSAGSMGSPYSEGGALYALGLIHANHGGEHVDYLLDALKNARDEVIQHGACLGLGLSAMATGRRDLLDELLNGVVYLDNAVAGEAAGIAMGLIMVGFGRASNVDDMLQFANDTKHEKIIRGIAMGIALSMLGQEEQADTMIEQLLRSKDPLLRYGGVYTVALAYVGTANNSAIRRLLHLAVSDVADDVRRAAVTGLGFVLCNEPARVPRVVSLLSESFNPYVRYGSAMAVGIACAGTGLPEALNLLFPMLKDRVDFVRQAAFIAIAMVLVQSNAVQEPRVAEYRTAITQAIELTKGGDTMTKMGALFGAGIIDAGGRNCTLTLRSPAGHKKMASIVGVAMFCQYWYDLHMFVSRYACSSLIPCF
jgi:26S proteasome regulatory subunit N2